MSFLRLLQHGYRMRSSIASLNSLDQLACQATVLEAEPPSSAVPGESWDRVGNTGYYTTANAFG